MQSALQPVKVWIWIVRGNAGIGRRVRDQDASEAGAVAEPYIRSAARRARRFLCMR